MVLYVVMVTGLTALFVWLKGRNTERVPASSAMVVSPEDDAAHDVVLVDVRTPEEYRAGHKEGALNIPVDEVEATGFSTASGQECRNSVILPDGQEGGQGDGNPQENGVFPFGEPAPV